MKTLAAPLSFLLLAALSATGCRDLRFLPDDDRATPPGTEPPNLPDAPDPIPAPRFTRIAVATDRSCAIDVDGRVLCWGLDLTSDEWGASLRAPAVVAGVEDAVEVALANTYACARIEGSGLECWGQTPIPGLAAGPQQPFVVAGSSEVTDFALGEGRVCGALASGGVRCWGIMTDPGDCAGATTAVVDGFDLPGVVDATTVEVSVSATCFMRADGSSACWLGVTGELVELPFDAAKRLRLSQSDGCFSASASICAVTLDGAVDCVEGFGIDALGDVARVHEADPPARALAWLGPPGEYCIETEEGTLWCKAAGGDVIAAEQVALSETHACVLSEEETLSCWGSNEWGALGIDAPARHREAVIVEGLTDVTTIAVGADHSCVAAGDGTLRCWGSNQSNQRGWVSDVTPAVYHPRWAWYPEELSHHPEIVPSLSATSGAFASDYRSCASETDGSVVCWGQDLTFTMSLAAPTAIANVAEATSIAAGDDSQSCAVTEGGDVKCWGRGWYGVRVGVETVSLPAAALEVDGDTYSTCALLENGDVYCWGGSVAGSVGNAGDPLMPQKLSGVADAIELSESCVVTAGHELVCWFFPWLPGAVEQGVPTLVASGITRVAGPCVVRDGGQAACFTDVGALDPLVDGLFDIAGAANAVDVATGSSHACALLADGQVACWGWAAAGRLGGAYKTVFTEPQQITTVLSD